MDCTIEARNLCKSFRGGVVAVNGLDLEVSRGAVFGLIGRNGAGKTTTLRLLLGLLRPDSGTARILGADFWTAARTVRQRVGYVAQRQQLPGWMTLEELCRYAAHFYDSWDKDLAADLARRWELPGQRPVARLSGGEQRQAAILLALSARPEVLLLDEPAAGLDAIARRSLLSCLVEAVTRGHGCTILLSTHLITDLERVADHIGIMDRGRLTTSARLEDLLQTTKRVQVVFDESSPPAGFVVPGAARTQVAGPVVTAITRLTSEAQLDPLRQMPGARLNVFPLNLEEIFIELFDQRRRDTALDDTGAPPPHEALEWAARGPAGGPPDFNP
jgi:ABC-2 type transport system ATP-binding protein